MRSSRSRPSRNLSKNTIRTSDGDAIQTNIYRIWRKRGEKVARSEIDGMKKVSNKFEETDLLRGKRSFMRLLLLLLLLASVYAKCETTEYEITWKLNQKKKNLFRRNKAQKNQNEIKQKKRENHEWGGGIKRWIRRLEIVTLQGWVRVSLSLSFDDFVEK